ncbi:HoxN/HupN/NixA family nickel/cobalt transporter [Humibacter sp.]|uniref:HoxN/HupN/NixA family nickel/cobalt transporter n=1 Tax=Humibacter sp. TaxID=1940291 RepID=UPI002BDACBE4|nr:HoxN/HupN/NixA family nickel/cobalt transporter [Humibacter sp.]HVX09382.1 HoxN/HupN/NixA family nickel/cobalt transporter [Humibacter sp.]
MAIPGGTPTSVRRGSASPARTYVAMYGVVVLLHVLGWGTLVIMVVSQGGDTGSTALGLGIGLTAYTLGMRHAFDADHIAAIDNTTRKLREHADREPVSVGFWFSLGHSSVVIVMVALVAAGVHALTTQFTDSSSFVSTYASLFGASVSGLFLLILGAVNFVVLMRIVRVYRDMRLGGLDEAELERQLSDRGLMNRIFGRLMGFITRPFHIYPIGVLFGFGFDTVSEIALLVIAGGAVANGIPWYAIMVLPVLFTAGMSLLDTTDGVFMNRAYGWAFDRPVRKMYYNMIVTSLSVVIAVAVGAIELIGVISSATAITSGPLGWIAGLDLNYVGFTIVGLFLAAWLVSLAIWRIRRVEERWTGRLVPTDDDV